MWVIQLWESTRAVEPTTCTRRASNNIMRMRDAMLLLAWRAAAGLWAYLLQYKGLGGVAGSVQAWHW